MAQAEDLVRPQPTAAMPPQQAALQALADTREASLFTRAAVAKLEELISRYDTPPEMRTIVINPGNNGIYTFTDISTWEARSVGILNPTSVNVYVGIGGVSATAGARAVPVAPQSLLVLPVRDYEIELGCDPTVLLANTAVFYLFRFLTVQPLNCQLLGP